MASILKVYGLESFAPINDVKFFVEGLQIMERRRSSCYIVGKRRFNFCFRISLSVRVITWNLLSSAFHSRGRPKQFVWA